MAGSDASNTDRAERLAAALRANLRKRKAQAREAPRDAGPQPTEAGDPPNVSDSPARTIPR